MARKKTLEKKSLTESLEELAHQNHTVDSDGKDITRAASLAELIWRNALGYTYLDVKTGKDVVVRPQKWAIDIVYDRLEGKVPMVSDDQTTRVTPAERIDELTKDSINDIAKDTVKK